MNFMGMGIPELAVIFLVAFLVLGPAKAIDTARNAGKMLGDLRRSFGDVTNAMSVETMEQQTPVRTSESDPQPESPPGVPIRAELPPEDEEGTGPPAESETDSPNDNPGHPVDQEEKG